LDAFQGYSGGSGGVFHRSERARSCWEGGGARKTGIVKYDVAAMLGGSRCGTEVRGASWEVQSGVEGFPEVVAAVWTLDVVEACILGAV
jgi:hypothetical protein